MDTHKLVTMANQIGDFFAAMPDQNEAFEGVTTHLKKFWDPRMRKALLNHIEHDQGEGLSAFTREALKTNQSAWR